MKDFSEISNLVSQLKAKDNDAFNYLYDNYSAALYGIIYRILNNEEDANDVLQEVFLNIWKKIDTYNLANGGTIYTWMLNIARNKAIDKYRENNRIIENQKVFQIVTTSNEHNNVNRIKDEIIGFNALVSTINPELNEIIDLHYYKGFTHQEIANIKNLPLGTVKTKIRTAMLALRKVFGTS